MLFAIGVRIQLKHTGAEGVVSQLLDEEMVMVRLDDGDEIPCFVEDLIRMEDVKRQLSNKPPVKAKIVKGKREKQPKAPELPEVQQQYAILKSLGIQLGFEAQMRSDGTTEKYLIHLINDTSFDVLYTFSMQMPNQVSSKQNGKLNSISTQIIGELLFDQLNDAPTIEVECWQVTTIGTGNRQFKSIRIKAQQFFKKVKTAPILNKPVHHYLVFENFEAEKERGEDLKSYTKRKAKPKTIKQDNPYYKIINDVTAYAEFDAEIDLHIDKLIDNRPKMSQAEILRQQLVAFDQYIEKAIR
ncbi:MAG: DUF2027 domain-containing protein, partial [Bacteroidota bacterium]